MHDVVTHTIATQSCIPLHGMFVGQRAAGSRTSIQKGESGEYQQGGKRPHTTNVAVARKGSSANNRTLGVRWCDSHPTKGRFLSSRQVLWELRGHFTWRYDTLCCLKTADDYKLLEKLLKKHCGGALPRGLWDVLQDIANAATRYKEPMMTTNHAHAQLHKGPGKPYAADPWGCRRCMCSQTHAGAWYDSCTSHSCCCCC